MVKTLENTVVKDESTETLMEANIIIPNEVRSDSYSLSNDSSVGTEAWSITPQSHSATVNIPVGAISNYIVLSDFPFNIPPEAVIEGIRVSLYKAGSIAGLEDSSVRLVKGGAVVGEDKPSSDPWPKEESGFGIPGDVFIPSPVNYGGRGDLWGVTWSPSDINSSGFWAALSASNPAGLTKGAVLNSYGSPYLSEIKIYYTLYNLVSR
jgi:hypothetical protein